MIKHKRIKASDKKTVLWKTYSDKKVYIHEEGSDLLRKDIVTKVDDERVFIETDIPIEKSGKK